MRCKIFFTSYSVFRKFQTTRIADSAVSHRRLDIGVHGQQWHDMHGAVELVGCMSTQSCQRTVRISHVDRLRVVHVNLMYCLTNKGVIKGAATSSPQRSRHVQCTFTVTGQPRLWTDSQAYASSRPSLHLIDHAYRHPAHLSCLQQWMV